MFEFEYAGELGTGHGPTMEFYALASQIISTGGENSIGFFPCWKNEKFDRDWFRIIGSLVARAWLDDRIIDIPINPIFLQSLINPDLIFDFDHLKSIDQELYNSLECKDNMIKSEMTYLIPCTDICILPGDKEIKTFEDAEEFKDLLMKRIADCMNEGRDSFLQGFNQSFPCSFHKCIKYFTVPEVSRLFSQSLDNSDWTPETIFSFLIPDHGYTSSSPQIKWLAEIIGETEGYESRGKMIKFLTGAAFLPIGGWKALKPPLTIVCKSDDNNSANSTPSLSPSDVNYSTHDSYLPSVMTCANYLKLPRYSSKEIMKERFEYAIKEGCNSFHLS